MKRISIFLITVALVAGMAGCSISPSQNLEIRTWSDLNAIRDNLGGSYILMNDLDSTTPGYTELASPTANQGKGWQPIGTFSAQFTGTFNGQGHKISDLFINRPDEMYVGLFGVVDNGGVIQGIGMVNGNVTGYAGVSSLTGGNEGIVSSSYSTGNVNGTGWVGGLVGSNAGVVGNSYSTGHVTGKESVGGLVGNNLYGTVSNSYSTGGVTGNLSVGGLVGNNTGAVNNSFWDIENSGQATSAGGIGKTTMEMKSSATFSGAGWNITAVANPSTRNLSYIWNIVNGQTYPFLSWQS
jgi:trimeric autotransporter adhesin